MTSCPSCAAPIDTAALSCPQCLRLTHAAELESLSRRAHTAWRIGNAAEEKLLWQQSLTLLPDATVQRAKIEQRLQELESLTANSSARPGTWRNSSAGIGSVLILALLKGKTLLLGLAKLSTLLTMLASFGVYWQLYGWPLAAGLVLSIYIHEMGHVIAIRHYGFSASAPMFIPGLGAFIRLRGVNVGPIPDSRIGLAGPLYGLGAAAAAYVLFLLTGAQIWGAIAHLGAMINLFNLIPVWSLDGSRGVRSLTRQQRMIVVAVFACLWLLTWNPMLFLAGAVMIYRLFTRDWQVEADQSGMLLFIGLLAALTGVAALTA
jgi:Zn-dependent protease